MIGLDFETFSSVDLKVHGAARYFESPDFQVLCAAVARTNGNVEYFDFVDNPTKAWYELKKVLDEALEIAAHNASFERAVCKKLDYNISDQCFVDTAAISRAVGAGSALKTAAPQLLGLQKLEMGEHLIRVFSVPTVKNGGKPHTRDQLIADQELADEWRNFLYYCGVDAELSLRLSKLRMMIPAKELRYELTTQAMNNAGWFVDLPLVEEMNRRYKENLARLEDEFRYTYDPQGKLNFRSHPQLQKWCADRGVNAKSFDQLAVPKMQRAVTKKLSGVALSGIQRNNYYEVLALLNLKQEMGGSSLSKLQTILNMVSADGRLRGQYLHVGAGQSYRTSGRGVQLQNLARLGVVIGNTDELAEPNVFWSNDVLSCNIRQVFKAQDPDGELIVGDFASVESRGLAYLAGEEWKLEAYRQHKDIYKLLAISYSANRGTSYDDVTKEQRKGGKVGELACGYGAGGKAVNGFAEKMGIDMEQAESDRIVVDWRAANPKIVAFWKALDKMLHDVLASKQEQVYFLPYGGKISLAPKFTPESMHKQHPGAQSIELSVYAPDGTGHIAPVPWMTRVFHGCYSRGNDVCYYKPSELKGGDLWRARMTTPPHAWFKLYGGKLAGILTQSFCRELFFSAMVDMAQHLRTQSHIKMIGQFHDEIVLEWTPSSEAGAWSLNQAKQRLEVVMANAAPWKSFPLEADVHSAHRYIK